MSNHTPRISKEIKDKIRDYILNYNRSNLPSVRTIGKMFPYVLNGKERPTSASTVNKIRKELKASE